MNQNINKQANVPLNQKPSRQNKQYICGCGKQYTSYPAYSTHRKIKHQNIDIQGSIIPKIQNPKRGRPSYQFKKVQSNHQQKQLFYKGLTVLQIGLLKLNEKFQNKILSQSSQSNHYKISKQLMKLAQLNYNETKSQDYEFDEHLFHSLSLKQQKNSLIPRIMIIYIQLMTTHMTKYISQPFIQFMTQLTIFLVDQQKKNSDKKKQNQFNQNNQNNQNNNQQLNQEQFDISIFNVYFADPYSKNFIADLCDKFIIRPDFFVDICIILSQWLYKIGVCSKVIKIKTEKIN